MASKSFLGVVGILYGTMLALNVAWREDEISELEVASIRSGIAAEHEAMLGLQKRLEATGVNPYEQNWVPTKPRL
jgi:hypothetical protein